MFCFFVRGSFLFFKTVNVLCVIFSSSFSFDGLKLHLFKCQSHRKKKETKKNKEKQKESYEAKIDRGKGIIKKERKKKKKRRRKKDANQVNKIRQV